jgi:hypothetical protein
MAFRRQDIPKTTRKGKDGAPRRLYPRFLRDQSMLPKIGLAIDYLEGMIGRKRSDLSPDVILDLFGDPKVARCVLSCLAERYRYRSLEFSEVIGKEAAEALAGWDLHNPADLRALVYQAANASNDGFVGAADRSRFLDELAGPMGLTGDQLDTLLTLDAEQNQQLVRVGLVPEPADIVARYNANLLASVLRYALSIDICTPGLERTTVDAVLARCGVEARRSGSELIRLIGRRHTQSGWAQAGLRLARAALQLIVLSPRSPDVQAVIHLGDQTSELTLDGKGLGGVRPADRAVADASGIVLASLLDEDVAVVRRRKGDTFATGWSIRRLPEPIYVADAMVVPELAFVRDELVVPVITIPSGPGRANAMKAIAAVGAQRPVVALGTAETAEGVYGLPTPEAARLSAILDDIRRDYDMEATPLKVLWSELAGSGWVAADRVTELFPGSDLPGEVREWLDDGIAAMVPGFGLGTVRFLEHLSDLVLSGPTDIAAVRGRIATEVGDSAAADALTLHLVGHHILVSSPPAEDYRERAAAA